MSGVHNVYTAWYVLDAEISTFYTFFEVFWNSFWIFFMAGHIFGYNLSFTNPYLYYAIILFSVIFIYQTNMTYVFCYNVINAVYLQSRYPQDTWVTVKFGTLWNFFLADNWLAPFVYLEQLFIGNKRLSMYNNFMMACILVWHPMLLPWSVYYWTQLPFQFILDVLVYPIFPVLDTPQIPWYEYFN